MDNGVYSTAPGFAGAAKKNSGHLVIAANIPQAKFTGRRAQRKPPRSTARHRGVTSCRSILTDNIGSNRFHAVLTDIDGVIATEVYLPAT